MGCKDIGIRIFEFVAKTQFLWKRDRVYIYMHIHIDLLKEKIQEQWAFKPADLHVNYKIVKLLDYIILCYVVCCVS